VTRFTASQAQHSGDAGGADPAAPSRAWPASHGNCYLELSFFSLRDFAMKVTTEYLEFHTKSHREYIHITPQVETILRNSGVQEGMVLVSAMHITAGIYVNDNESGLIEDIDQWLEKLAPFNRNYRHHQTGEDNGDSHLKALLIHHEVIVPVTAGKLDLGTWQRVFYAEFDGRRDKRVIVKVMGE
jgi:secondary thiamine-phosphate synthase enzyme